MIRVGSMSGCCCEDDVTVAGREATAASNDIDGVLNRDCLLYKSGGVSSVAYKIIISFFCIINEDLLH
jgi:hypothetical protein